MSAPHNTYEIEIPIQQSDIDMLGHVNNTVYLKWVQQTAIAHWNALTSVEERETLLWVVARHEIDYKRPVFLEDKSIIARTWVGEANTRTFARHTEIVRKNDGKLLAQAKTFWAPVDPKTKKPVRPGPEVYARFSTQTPE